VQEAEAHPRLAVFPDLDDEPDVAGAWRYLERSEFRPDPPEPTEPLRVTVALHDGTPIR
jgi:hypothetical protein